MNDRLVTIACMFDFFLNEMHVKMVIQMFPSNKIELAVGATVLRQLPGAQLPIHLPEILPCIQIFFFFSPLQGHYSKQTLHKA